MLAAIQQPFNIKPCRYVSLNKYINTNYWSYWRFLWLAKSSVHGILWKLYFVASRNNIIALPSISISRSIPSTVCPSVMGDAFYFVYLLDKIYSNFHLVDCILCEMKWAHAWIQDRNNNENSCRVAATLCVDFQIAFSPLTMETNLQSNIVSMGVDEEEKKRLFVSWAIARFVCPNSFRSFRLFRYFRKNIFFSNIYKHFVLFFRSAIVFFIFTISRSLFIEWNL